MRESVNSKNRQTKPKGHESPTPTMNPSASPSGTECTYYQICGLQSSSKFEGKYYCILHFPSLNKNDGVFNQALKDHLCGGSSDFRHFYFPDGYIFPQGIGPFPALADFRDSVFYNDLNLQGAILPFGLNLKATRINAIRLENATVDGDVRIEIEGNIDAVSANGLTLSKALSISAQECRALYFQVARITGKVDVDVRGKVEHMTFHSAHLTAGLGVQANSAVGIYFNAPATIIGETSIEITDAIGNINASSAEFQGNLVIQAGKLNSLVLTGSKVDGLVTLRTQETDVKLSEAEIGNGLDFQHCDIAVSDSSFQNITFAPSAKLTFDYAVLRGNLIMVGSLKPPGSLSLNGCTITGSTAIGSELGKPLIEVVAKDVRPEFTGDVSFANVDLKRCKLVGNSIDKMRFSNVTWNQQNGRAALYDESVLKADGSVTKNIKEAYQVLKEIYRQMGDHVTSGDFHYGEMQMKRREYGRVSRHCGLTAWYYYLSGYGTNPRCAALALANIVVLFTCLFNILGDVRLQQDILEAFLVSVQAATLQPVPSDDFSLSTRILFSIERIVAPLQIALLALAVRMRLRR